MCAMTLTSIGWDLRNKAKNDQRNANCELLHFFFKNCPNNSNEDFNSLFTLCGGRMCAMTLIS